MRASFTLAVLLAAGPSAAQEFVYAPRPLTPDEFYLAVACAAPPGGACRKPFLRWPERRRGRLTVGVTAFPDGIGTARRALFEHALVHAVTEINALDAGIRLRPAGPGVPDIALRVLAGTARGGAIGGRATLHGAAPALARVEVRAVGGEVREATIAVSDRAPDDEIRSLVLEEVVQALGLMTDLAGPGARGSIFAEDQNSTTRLDGPDADAVRRHYGRTPD